MAKPDQIQLRRDFHYDDVTGLLSRREVYSNRGKVGRPVGTPTDYGYLTVRYEGKFYPAHHIIWCWMTGVWPVELDHEDLCKTNNRWKNLREATRFQNMCNRPAMSNSKSQVKGVSWHKAAGKWRASITAMGKTIHLGLFVEIEDAKLAYADKARELHGVFARIG